MTRDRPRNYYVQQRDRLLKRLRKLCSRLPKRDWLFAAWVLDRGRGNKNFQQPPGFNYPQQYLTASISEAGAIHSWEIETLTTECLACSLRPGPRVLNVGSWSAIAQLVDLLREIGNAETGLTEPKEILRNIRRVLSQQLPWQVHHHTVEDYVRWWFIFKSETLQSIFLERTGVSFEKFCLMGLSWALILKENLCVNYPVAERALGLAESDIKAFVKATCTSLDQAIEGAKEIVATGSEIDFRKSNLRQKPVIMIGDQFICPLWQLFLWRITSGLYYDVVADVKAPHEIGRMYEEYTLELLKAVAEGLEVLGEVNYGSTNKPKLSPDCIVHRRGTVEMLVECKAKKLPQVAQHSMVDTKERADSIRELAKGVVQLCRFERALKQSAVASLSGADKIVLLLVTLDDFIFTGPDITESVFSGAAEIASKVGERFERIERKDIALCTATELDELCSRYLFEDIKRICSASSQDRFKEYALINVAQEGFNSERRADNYPLAHLMDELCRLPDGSIAASLTES